MGCTHYPLMQTALNRWFEGAKLVHSGEAIVEYLKANYPSFVSEGKTRISFFASESVNRLKDVAAKWLSPHISTNRL
jgi:glutamate racemase